MRRLSFGIASAASIAMALGIAGGLSVATTTNTIVEPTPARQAPSNPAAPERQQPMATAEREAVTRYRYGGDGPTKHKTRAGGERAHRRWRKARSAGRRG